MTERYELAVERIKEIPNENIVKEPFEDYFKNMASFVVLLDETRKSLSDGILQRGSIEELAKMNAELYEDILPDNYEKSYGNPKYAVAKMGSELGAYLSFLYEQLRGIIPYLFRLKKEPDSLEDIVILLELFLQVYSEFCAFAQESTVPSNKDIKDILYYYVSDYSDVTVPQRVRELLDPSLDFITDIIMNADLSDLRYLYSYGEYISEDEIKTAEYINTLSEEEIKKAADVYTEGYRIGFIQTGKDLSIKDTVDIRGRVGYERILRVAIDNFKAMKLRPIIFKNPVHAGVKVNGRTGFYGGIPNKQYEYDHKEDNAIYYDKAYADRKLMIMENAYNEYKELAKGYAGPAVLISYGEDPFSPDTTSEALKLNEKQQKLSVEYMDKTAQLTNRYIIQEERSFTIISWPSPQIGKDYEEIFKETLKLNTLDYIKYRDIQQKIIEALDKGIKVHIKGMGDNKTDLVVALRDLTDIEHQTQFENCVADVNIPVGEVFTSPVLAGSNGVLNVSEVYLNGLMYKDLTIVLEDGFVKDYSCANFDDEKAGKKYIKDNILYNHESLPIGEFAIGTNTTAYAMAKKYKIFDRLDILIAEKTGPHFALGDTCYSYAEDIAVYNPDGREIISRDNEVSAKRTEDPSKAYFHCHTDITIPYDELGSLSVEYKSGDVVDIISKGRFVLAGTEELNEPLYN